MDKTAKTKFAFLNSDKITTPKPALKIYRYSLTVGIVGFDRIKNNISEKNIFSAAVYLNNISDIASMEKVIRNTALFLIVLSIIRLYNYLFIPVSTNSILTGLWSEYANPVFITALDVTSTFSDTMKPSTVMTYCPS